MRKKSLCIWGMIALTIFLGGCSCARQNATGNAPDESSMSQDSNHSGETDRTEGAQNETEGSQNDNPQGQTEYNLSPEAFAQILKQCAQNGAGLLGGCCGTTPAHIAALKNQL